MFPVISRFLLYVSYMVFLIKLFLVVSGNLNCFWLFFICFLYVHIWI